MFHRAAAPLETARLRLREFQTGDLDDLEALWADPKVHQHITGKPMPRQDVWFKILRAIGHWQALGFGYWVVEDKATARLIGEMGYGDFHRPNMPLLEDRPELGWILAADHHGKGLAFEALSAIQDWGDHNLRSSVTCCIISPANAASIRLAVKLGFVFAAMAGEKGDPVGVYLRNRA